MLGEFRMLAAAAAAVLYAVLGSLVILLPTRLIGVCTHPEASCNLVMRPAMILTGSLLVGVSLVALAVSERGLDYGVKASPTPATAHAEAERTDRTAGV
jgi:hypothetical protein